MLPLAADENLNNDIVRGVLRRNRQVDIVSLQDAGLARTDDPTVLEWAAAEGRVLLTHDVATMTRYAYERVRAGKPIDAAAAAGVDLRLARAAQSWFAAVEDDGQGDQDYSAVLARIAAAG